MTHYRVLLTDNVEVGKVQQSDFTFEKSSSPPHTEAELNDGQVLVEPVYVSVDPYMRGRFKASTGSYVGGFQKGHPIESGIVGKVIASKDENFAVGDYVVGTLSWESTTIAPAARLQKVNTSFGLPLSYYVGALGMPGLTAYSSLFEFSKLTAGKTIFVSASAGAVGQLVGQIAHVNGLKVIGSVGSDDKAEYLLKELQFDGAINYKKFPTSIELANELKRLAPQGIDIYYENVGGVHLEAALEVLNNKGVVIACGMISEYDGDHYDVKNFFKIIGKQLSIHGFLVNGIAGNHIEAFKKDMGQWVADGKIKVKEELREGWENVGSAFVELMGGKNTGKMSIKVGNDPFRK